MHIADYIVLGLLIACMLGAVAVVLSRSSHNRGGGKRRGRDIISLSAHFIILLPIRYPRAGTLPRHRILVPISGPDFCYPYCYPKRLRRIIKII